MAQRTGTRTVPVALPREETAPEHWLRTIRFSGFTVLMLMVVILAVIVLAPNLRIYFEQQQRLAQLTAEVAEAQGSVDTLTKDVARWSDPAYIESQARERLFYVFPGDVSYLVVGDAAASATSDGQPISDRIQTTKVDWLKTLLSSVYTAGLTDAPPAELAGPTPTGSP
jgi:cell division protein FtsB